MSLSRATRRRRRKRAVASNRNLMMEALEDRRLLASDFQNAFNEFDVDDDGVVAPLDALLIINDLNASGPRHLPAVRSGSDPFIDVTGDGVSSPLDALIVINALNAGGLGNLVALTES